MFTKVNCPHCTKGLKVRNEHAGRTCRCPHCSRGFRVPEPTFTPPESGPSISEPGAAKSVVKSTASSRPRRSSGSGEDASNVGLALSGGLGLVGSVVILALLYPLRGGVGALFWDRGWVPFVLVILTSWSLAILGLKWLKLSKQRSAMLLDLLPTEVSASITLDSLDRFIAHIESLPSSSSGNVLLNRVVRGLEHFRVRKSAPETITMMESQSDIDANNAASSYTVIKVFIWALPILGFIGTVIGVSQAVASLSGSLENASDVSAIKGALNAVFAGLGTAFDTTLLALVLSLLVKLPTTAMQKAEEDLVTWVDEYCNENLLKRLDDGRDGGAERTGGVPNLEPFRQAVEEALAKQHAEAEKWEHRMESIGKSISSQVAVGWQEISHKVSHDLNDVTTNIRDWQSTGVSQAVENLETMQRATEQISETLANASQQSTELGPQVHEMLDGVANRIEGQFARLEVTLSGLNKVLGELGEKQVVVQQVEKPRKGWFSRR